MALSPIIIFELHLPFVFHITFLNASSQQFALVWLTNALKLNITSFSISKDEKYHKFRTKLSKEKILARMCKSVSGKKPRTMPT
jgi:hypothetical protein